MSEYLVSRLKEVKGLNLSRPTVQSITDVVKLWKNRWQPPYAFRSEKARAAARSRARTLIHEETLSRPPERPWPPSVWPRAEG